MEKIKWIHSPGPTSCWTNPDIERKNMQHRVRRNWENHYGMEQHSYREVRLIRRSRRNKIVATARKEQVGFKLASRWMKRKPGLGQLGIPLTIQRQCIGVVMGVWRELRPDRLVRKSTRC